VWNKNKVPTILEVQNQNWCTCTAAIIIPLIHNVPHFSICGFRFLFHLWQLFKPHIFYPKMQYICLIWRHMAWRSFTFWDMWLGFAIKCKWRWHSTSTSIFTYGSMDKAGDQYSLDIKYVSSSPGMVVSSLDMLYLHKYLFKFCSHITFLYIMSLSMLGLKRPVFKVWYF
jgi:hypothetical protein